MCLAIPGKVLEMYEEAGLNMGKIDYNGTLNTCCLAYVPDVKLGDYVLVHAGFALQTINEEEAQDTFDALQLLADAMEEEETK